MSHGLMYQADVPSRLALPLPRCVRSRANNRELEGPEITATRGNVPDAFLPPHPPQSSFPNTVISLYLSLHFDCRRLESPHHGISSFFRFLVFCKISKAYEGSEIRGFSPSRS